MECSNRRWTPTSGAALLACMVFAIGACAGAPEDWTDGRGTVDSERQSIVGGTSASTYPEAALVDMYQKGQLRSACSGAVVAPRVVLTAGHCVDGFDGWRITAPFLDKKVVMKTSEAAVYDWKNYPSSTVNPAQHDVALVFLSAPIDLRSYPTLASVGVPEGTSVVNIGRKRDGVLSMNTLYVSKPLTVSDGGRYGYGHDYRASNLLEPGDSGGPVEELGTHNIVAVNSGGGGDSEVLARVDMVYSWIHEQIEAHGGW